MSDDLFQDLDNLAGRAKAEIQQLTEQREAIDNRLKRLRRVLSVVETPVVVVAKKKPSNGSKPGKLAPITLRVAEIIEAHPLTEPFTVHDTHALVNTLGETWSFESTRNALTQLRRIEYLGKAAPVPVPGQRGITRTGYRVMDRDVVKRMIDATAD